jgi:uncharacterized repeat protein (TIGR03803 family)
MGKLGLLRMIGVVSMFSIAATIASPAQTFTTLANFDLTNGAGPNAGPVQGTDGNVYGITGLGGASNNCTLGCGTVFKIIPSGIPSTVTTLHSFNGTDGSFATGLVQGTDGNFYGTTANGGSSNNCTDGCGTVFKITARGALTTLHSFNGSDGSGPYSGLVEGTDGNFYGTTDYGGSSNNCTLGCGTVFKITSKGALTTLYNFCSKSNCADGSSPQAGLIQATDGNFYGTTFSGGILSGGTVFRMTGKGALTTLYNFCSKSNCADGSSPYAALIQGIDGNVYGTTEGGGTNYNGTVFRMTAKGALTTLHSFDNADGYSPSGLVQGTDGNLYGTTQGGGAIAFGTVFQITTNGTLTTLHSFDDSDGADPQSAPVQATNGMFFGTTFFAGDGGFGSVYTLAMGLGPFVRTNPTSGNVGTKVTILGNNLADATSVTFNGTEATFKASGTYITTTVPTGANTGTVEVVTPKTILKSNVDFRVP